MTIFTGYHISTFISLMIFSKVLTTAFWNNCLHTTKFVSQSYSIFMYMFCRSLFVFCTFSFGHCAVRSFSIYEFWLPLWYLQTLLKYIMYIKFKVKTYRFQNEPLLQNRWFPFSNWELSIYIKQYSFISWYGVYISVDTIFQILWFISGLPW